ncbi:hypothetical protein FD754_001782, partial [Muntiacus muntjak]
VVKPHTPLISFPDRRDSPKPNGPPDTAEIIKTLPQRYRRKLVSQEEIEFIQCGGPE